MQKAKEDHDGLLTAKQVAEFLKVEPVTVYSWHARGLLSGFKLGSSVRFHPADLQEFLRRGRRESSRTGAAGN